MIPPAVFPVEHFQSFSLLNNHKAAEQSLNCFMCITNLFCYVFEINPEISVHIRDILRFGITAPFGRTVYMLEAQITLGLFPRTGYCGDFLQRFFGVLSNAGNALCQSRDKIRIQKQFDRRETAVSLNNNMSPVFFGDKHGFVTKKPAGGDGHCQLFHIHRFPQNFHHFRFFGIISQIELGQSRIFAVKMKIRYLH